MGDSTSVPQADIASRCRAVLRPGAYYLLPQDNRVLSSLPQLRNGSAQVLASPASGARFVEHELLMLPSGRLSVASAEPWECFLFVLEGDCELLLDEGQHVLEPGGFAWLPPGLGYELSNSTDSTSRVIWLCKRYERVAGLAVPAPIIADERDVPALPEDTYTEQHLIPYEDLSFDMGMNLLSFEAGVHFGAVESHVMEHGLYMLDGRGLYWLNGEYHEVQAGDFIYMAPHCPQFFYATGWGIGRYLLYKDVNRDYTSEL